MIELGIARGGQVRLVGPLDRRAHVRDRAGGERRAHELHDQRLRDRGPLDQDEVALAELERVVGQHPREPAQARVDHRNRPSR